ncbi:GTPase HflX [Rhodobacteraceae bacterium NNCM2]|nr:GTPase HflX [Coraliihabitans acroporae]
MTISLVLNPIIRGQGGSNPERQLEEAIGLAGAIDLEIAEGLSVQIDKRNAATFLGSGKVSEIAEMIARHDAELVVMNTSLSPVQQRNLEREWKAKVLDRTGLILEIFGRRAQTREGVMQVDLAHLTYQKSRLVRSWTHLERQRGGAGFMGGPGERQIESDRRVLDEKITRLRRQLEKVVRTRSLHRASRKKAPYPVVVLVGYTNAGKSTLFNRLTDASVLAADMLFATLDPTMREIKLPSGRMAILSDTVGFISDLPTELVAAFRATLEEVLEADLIVHVRDISSPVADQEAKDVENVLETIGVAEDAPAIDVLNKIDMLEEPLVPSEHRRNETRPVFPVSAKTGEGCDRLIRAIDDLVYPDSTEVSVTLRHNDGAALSWLYSRGVVSSREDTDDGVLIRVVLTKKEYEQFKKEFQIKAQAT